MVLICQRLKSGVITHDIGAGQERREVQDGGRAIIEAIWPKAARGAMPLGSTKSSTTTLTSPDFGSTRVVHLLLLIGFDAPEKPPIA